MLDYHDVLDTLNDAIRQRKVTATFTRPANTTAYAAGDVVNDSVSAPTVITFSGCAAAPGLGGVIVDVIMVGSANQTTAGTYELWLFDTTVTPDNDNAVFTPTDAECATLVAIIPLNLSYVGDATAGAGGNRVYQSDGANRQFVCAAGDRDLYGVLVVRNAYTPVSAEVFTFSLKLL